MMKKIPMMLLAVSFIAMIVVGCTEGPAGEVRDIREASPTPCVTATPATTQTTMGEAVAAGEGYAEPAGRTSGGNPQATPDPAELATREAQLAKQNQPIKLPGEGTAMPVCPTPTARQP